MEVEERDPEQDYFNMAVLSHKIVNFDANSNLDFIYSLDNKVLYDQAKE